VIQTLSDYYCLPLDLFSSRISCSHPSTGNLGFFRFGTEICYGKSRTGVAKNVEASERFDALANVSVNGEGVEIPFDFEEIVENLRRERYHDKLLPRRKLLLESQAARSAYYQLRGYLPRSMRRQLQRLYFHDWKKLSFPAWPVDFTVDSLHESYLQLIMKANGLTRVPFIWFWPEGAPSCLVITHDVEMAAGRDFTPQLMELDDSHGFKASFQVVPEKRYEVSNEYIAYIRSHGFEFNIHDLNHDGRLYLDKEEFLRRAARINALVHRYESSGFRAGSLYRNQDWYDAFEFSYDMSVPNVAHLDPQRGGCATVMPYFVGKILELPVTTAQDYSVFYILNQYDTDFWKAQIDLIRSRNGLISILTHPDYLIEPRARQVYTSLLNYLRQTVAREKIWATLPGQLDRWWRARAQMRLVTRNNRWEIVGPESDKARVAYAVVRGSRLTYELVEVPSRETDSR
jgi:hypothetical protein